MPILESHVGDAFNTWNPLRRFAQAIERMSPDSFSRPPADSSLPGEDHPDSVTPANASFPPAAASLEARDLVPQSAPPYKPVVLVVEHVADDAERIANHLADAGCYPPLAGTAAEGIALARRVQPNVILVNQALPDLSGFRMVQQLASDPLTAHCPAILVGRTDDPGTRAYALRAGAVSVLSKEDELSSALINAVQRYRRLQPNRDQLESARLLDAERLDAIVGIVAELSGDPYLNDRGKAAVIAAEVEALMRFPVAGGELRDRHGRVLDDDHTWLAAPGGWIVDPSIRRFRDAILGWPGVGDIAVIPPASPLADCYIALR